MIPRPSYFIGKQHNSYNPEAKCVVVGRSWKTGPVFVQLEGGTSSKHVK